MEIHETENWWRVVEDDIRALKRTAREVLRQTVNDLSYSPSEAEIEEHIRMTRDEARAWLLDDIKEWGSFLHLCEITKRNPNEIRKRLGI